MLLQEQAGETEEHMSIVQDHANNDNTLPLSLSHCDNIDVVSLHSVRTIFGTQEKHFALDSSKMDFTLNWCTIIKILVSWALTYHELCRAAKNEEKRYTELQKRRMYQPVRIYLTTNSCQNANSQSSWRPRNANRQQRVDNWHGIQILVNNDIIVESWNAWLKIARQVILRAKLQTPVGLWLKSSEPTC